jgi:glycosyltransferase involved in cell wall biosynthesis
MIDINPQRILSTMNPRISIIVPVYNVEAYLQKCLESILRQTFSDFECILIDDGSTDNSSQICDEYSRKDNRIIVIHQKNKGVSEARNAGLRIARGEWIGFTDPDDWCEAEMFQFLYTNAIEKKVDISICGVQRITRGRAVKNRYFFKESIISSKEAIKYLFSPGGFGGYMFVKLIRAQIIHENKVFFNPEIKLSEDVLFSLEIFLHASYVFISPRILYNYFNRPDSAINSSQKIEYKTQDENGEKLKNLFLKYIADPEIRERILDVKRHSYYMGIAHRYFISLSNGDTNFNSEYTPKEINKGLLLAIRNRDIGLGTKILYFLALNKKIFNLLYPIWKKIRKLRK